MNKQVAAVGPAAETSFAAVADPAPEGKRVRLLFLVTVDWFFSSHYLNRALAARQAGYEVLVVTHLDTEDARLRAAGLVPIHWRVRRKGLNPLTELQAIQQLVQIYRTRRPDLVHQIALKPIVYGSLAARISGLRGILNAPVGMGFVFSSPSLLARALRPLVLLALRALLNPPGSRVVFENSDDRATAIADGLVRERDAVLIRGAGVDIRRFTPAPEPPGRPRVLLIARMLWDKGVGEFVEAARLLRRRGVEADFVLVGRIDQDNRACIDEIQLRAWKSEGVIDWLGHQEDVPGLLAGCHVVALPSYREGLPKSLLEALAAGRPIVTTDVPGCREVVIPGENGLLVRPRDGQALAEALSRLIKDAALRQRFGAASRRLAERNFGTEKVEQATLALYADMLRPERTADAGGEDR
ncbi:MAG: glycosyltransferase family 1 protein [Chromatiaceae bacterium]|nr:MAG: glycosyltransferase family 1 protein [Chromatiaceae bacterium]